jgi:hypothetical protein
VLLRDLPITKSLKSKYTRRVQQQRTACLGSHHVVEMRYGVAMHLDVAMCLVVETSTVEVIHQVCLPSASTKKCRLCKTPNTARESKIV